MRLGKMEKGPECLGGAGRRVRLAVNAHLALGPAAAGGSVGHGPGWPCCALGPAGDHAGTLGLRIGHHTARHPRCGGAAERGAAEGSRLGRTAGAGSGRLVLPAARGDCKGAAERGTHLTEGEPLHAAADWRTVTGPTQGEPAPPPKRLGPLRGRSLAPPVQGRGLALPRPRGAGALTSGCRRRKRTGTPRCRATVRRRPRDTRHPCCAGGRRRRGSPGGCGPGLQRPESALRSPRPDPIGVLSGRLGSPLPSRRGNYPSPRPNPQGPLGAAFLRAHDAPLLYQTGPRRPLPTATEAGPRNSPTLPGCADPQGLSGL